MQHVQLLTALIQKTSIIYKPLHQWQNNCLLFSTITLLLCLREVVLSGPFLFIYLQ